MNTPLVSVICISYNHGRFVEEAVNSVLNQTYKNIELIVVDDASKDDSSIKIRMLAEKNPSIKTLLLEENIGNCKAFNRGFAMTQGDYIIDFATDDVMLPDRIEKQIRLFNALNKNYGVVFTDAIYIDENGKMLRNHFEYLFRKGLLKKIPQGDVYDSVLSTYFIPSPTMLVRREVFLELNGYDENLSYEDFDFWVRSAREFKYAYLDEKLTKIRRVGSSMSAKWYVPGDRQLHSTYLVCKKAQKLNRTPADNIALARRVKYELRQSVFSQNHDEARLFFDLLGEINAVGFFDRLLIALNRFRLPLSFLRRWYHGLRYDT